MRSRGQLLPPPSTREHPPQLASGSSGDQFRQERCAFAAKGESEPIGDCSSEIGERRPLAQITGNDTKSAGQQRDTFPSVVRRWCRWIVAMVGSYEQQVVLFESRCDGGQGSVELAQRT